MTQQRDPDKLNPPVTLIDTDVYEDSHWSGHSIHLKITNMEGVTDIFFTQEETKALIQRLQFLLHDAQEKDLGS